MATLKMTRAEYQQKYGVPAPASSAPTPIPQSNIGSTISSSFKSGIDQTKAGYLESKGSQNPLKQVAGSVKMLAGVANTALSPLSPLTNLVTKPIAEGFAKGPSQDSPLGKLTSNPSVQKFASSPTGMATSRTAEFAGDLSTVAGTIGGGLEVPKVAGALGEAASPLVRGTGRILKGTGEGAYGTTVIPSEATAKSVLNYNAKQPSFSARIKNMVAGTEPEGKPITEANTAARKGLMGTEYEIGVQSKQIANKLWNETIAPKLDAVKGVVNMKTFVSELKKDIVKNTKELGRRNALLEAADAFGESYKNVSKINLKKLQEYKEGWAQFIPEATYKGKPIGSALKEIQNLAASKARDVIYKYVGKEGQQAYIDYGNLQSIIKSGIKSTTGDPASKSISRNTFQFVMDKAVTPIMTTAGKVLYRTGEGLEFVGKKGAKTVGEALGEAMPSVSKTMTQPGTKSLKP